MTDRRQYTPAEAFFNRPYLIDERIIKTKAEIERLDYLMLPSGISYDKPQVQTTPEDILAKYAAEKADLEAYLADLQRAYLAARENIKSILEELDRTDARAAMILTEYYINHKSMGRIARDHHYNRQHLYRLRRDVLKTAWYIFIKRKRNGLETDESA